MLESPEFVAGDWRGGEKDADGVIHRPWFELSPQALEFVGALGKHGWIVVFDWMAWDDEARRLIERDGLAAPILTACCDGKQPG